MTTDIDIDTYAVVWFDKDGTPKICTGMLNGVDIDGKTYAIYDTAEEAVAEFGRWPLLGHAYGIMPTRLLVEKRPRYVLKDFAKS